MPPAWGASAEMSRRGAGAGKAFEPAVPHRPPALARITGDFYEDWLARGRRGRASAAPGGAGGDAMRVPGTATITTGQLSWAETGDGTDAWKALRRLRWMGKRKLVLS